LAAVVGEREGRGGTLGASGERVGPGEGERVGGEHDVVVDVEVVVGLLVDVHVQVAVVVLGRPRHQQRIGGADGEVVQVVRVVLLPHTREPSSLSSSPPSPSSPQQRHRNRGSITWRWLVAGWWWMHTSTTWRGGGSAYIAHGDVGVVLVLLEHHVLRHTQHAWPDTPPPTPTPHVVVVSDSRAGHEVHWQPLHPKYYYYYFRILILIMNKK
jgi:hypothetical protein